MWKINSLGTALSKCNLFFSSVKLQSNTINNPTHTTHTCVHTQKAKDFTIRLSLNLRIFIRNFSLKKGLNKINSPLVAVTKVIKRTSPQELWSQPQVKEILHSTPRNFQIRLNQQGFPWWLSGKKPPCQCRRRD